MEEPTVELLGQPRAVRGSKRRTFFAVKINGEVYNRGDVVLMRASDPSDPPYIGRVVRFINHKGEVSMTVEWFYRLRDTHIKTPPRYPNEIFATSASDLNPVRTIIQKAKVSSCVSSSFVVVAQRMCCGPSHVCRPPCRTAAASPLTTPSHVALPSCPPQKSR